jgi:hypothetical protein
MDSLNESALLLKILAKSRKGYTQMLADSRHAIDASWDDLRKAYQPAGVTAIAASSRRRADHH